MSLPSSLLGISNSNRSPIWWTVNMPFLVLACRVTTRLYGSGFGAPACVAPPPPRPPRPAPPPPPPVGASAVSAGALVVTGACRGPGLVGAGLAAGAGVLAVLQPIANTAAAAEPKTRAERVRIYTLRMRGTVAVDRALPAGETILTGSNVADGQTVGQGGPNRGWRPLTRYGSRRSGRAEPPGVRDNSRTPDRRSGRGPPK